MVGRWYWSHDLSKTKPTLYHWTAAAGLIIIIIIVIIDYYYYASDIHATSMMNYIISSPAFAKSKHGEGSEQDHGLRSIPTFA